MNTHYATTCVCVCVYIYIYLYIQYLQVRTKRARVLVLKAVCVKLGRSIDFLPQVMTKKQSGKKTRKKNMLRDVRVHMYI